MKHFWVVAYCSASVLMSLLNQVSVKSLNSPSTLLAIQALCSILYLVITSKDETRKADIVQAPKDPSNQKASEESTLQANGSAKQTDNNPGARKPSVRKRSSELAQRSTLQDLMQVLPSAVLFALSLDTRMRALQKTSTAAVTVVRSLVPLPVALGEWAFLSRQFSGPSLVALIVTALGGWLYSSGGKGVPIAPHSALFLGLHLSSTAAQLVYAKAVSSKLPPRKVNLYLNLLSFPLFLASSITNHEPQAFAPNFGRLTPALKLAVVATAPVSIVLSLAQSHSQALLSATSFITISNVLKVATILASYLTGLEAPRGLPAWGGLTLTIGGGFLYAREQWRQKRRTVKAE